MEPGALERLLRPRSIAVVGGGPWCRAVVERCRADGFAGEIHAVHPERPEVAGVPAVASVAALAVAPDAVFVGVNRDAALDVVRALAARGAGGAVCFANGFAETGEAGGLGRQAALVEAAGPMALLGPNCYGFLNRLDGASLWPDQHGAARVGSGVAIVTQSSNVALNLTMQRRGLRIAYLVASGNQACLGFAALGEALLEDPRVTALGLHVEGFGDVRALERLAARAGELGKPVVALKAGRSDAARTATLSHTASLAGSEAGADALMARLGIGRADSLEAFLGALQLLHVHPGLARARRPLRISSASCSGGEAALVADAAARAGSGLTFAPLDDARRAALRDALGARITLANPLDYDTHVWRDGDALECVYAAMAGPDVDLALLVLDVPRGDRCDAAEWDVPLAALRRAASRSSGRHALLATLPESLPEALANELVEAGIAPLAGIDAALAAALVASGSGTGCARAGGEGTTRGMDDSAPPAPVLLAAALNAARTVDEARTKRLLAAAGVPVPRGLIATDPDRAAEAAARLGFPVVVKGLGIAHKSDAGVVVLGLRDASAVRDAAARVLRALPADARSDAPALLVESMVEARGVELLVGVVRDPAHGFVLTLGAGGTLTELLADRACLLLPATRASIDTALSTLRIGRALDGVRGNAAVDRAALLDAVLAVQDFVVAHAPDVVELEINPLLAASDGCTALDALLVASDALGG